MRCFGLLFLAAACASSNKEETGMYLDISNDDDMTEQEEEEEEEEEQEPDEPEEEEEEPPDEPEEEEEEVEPPEEPEEEEPEPAEDCPEGWADPHEPNDEVPTDFGDKDGEEFAIEDGYLHPETDADRYTFAVVDGLWDGWDVAFDVQAKLTDVPDEADLKLQLIHVTNSAGDPGYGLVDESDDGGPGGDEAVSISEVELTFWTDRGGIYEVKVVSSSGSSCLAPYTLTIGADTR